MDYKSASEKLRAFAATIVEPDANQGETADRCIAVALQQAAFDAVRDEWQHFVDADPVLKSRLAVAKELMQAESYGELDPICSVPGIKPMIAMVGDKEVICLDYSMKGSAPLSAIFTNRVSQVLDAAAKVEATQLREAEAASAAEQPAPPQTPQSE